MADLNYNQAAQPIAIVDEVSGYTATVDSGGALKVTTSTVGPADISSSGTITALNGTVQILPAGCQAVSFVLTGTWSGTIVAEVSSDTGSTWTQTSLHSVINDGVPPILSSVTSNGTYKVGNTGGVGVVRVRASTFSSGSIAVVIRASSMPHTFMTGYMRLQDATGTQTAVVTAQGALRVSNAGASAPETPGAGEAVALRSYTTVREVTLNNSGTEYPLLYFRNPSGSGKKIYISQLSFTNLAGSGKNFTLRVFANPTATVDGTAVTPVSLNVGGGAPAASVLVTHTPTITANGSTIAVAAQTNEQANILLDWGLIIQPNNSFLISGVASANNTPVVINVIWSEAT